MRATETKFNKRVYFVAPNDLEFETKCNNLNIELTKGVKSWMENRTDLKQCNLNKEEKEGLIELNEMIQDKKCVVFQTDKSKKASIDVPSNYKNDMDKYVKNHETINEKQVNQTTRMYNNIGKGLVSILGMGKSVGHDKRNSKNVHVTENGEIPVMCGFFKDHKDGRKYRQLVNGNVGPIANVSYIVSKILNPYVDEMKETLGNNSSKSTKELPRIFMLQRMEKYQLCVASSKIIKMVEDTDS